MIIQIIPFVIGQHTTKELEISIKSSIRQDPPFNKIVIAITSQGSKETIGKTKEIEKVTYLFSKIRKEVGFDNTKTLSMLASNVQYGFLNQEDGIIFHVASCNNSAIYYSILECGNQYSNNEMIKELRKIYSDTIFEIDYPPAIIQFENSSGISCIIYSRAYRQMMAYIMSLPRPETEDVLSWGFAARLEKTITSVNSFLPNNDKVDIGVVFKTMKECQLIE